MRSLLVLITAAAAMAASPEKDAGPLFFVENRGQAPEDVAFMAQGTGLTAYFSPGEARFAMPDGCLRLEFLNGNPAVRVEGIEPLEARAHFLTGREEDWRTDVPLYGAVMYRDLYPGIDMRYGGKGRNFKSEFVASPGADPSSIRLAYAGAAQLRLDEDGALVMTFGNRELREEAPVIYQQRGGERVSIAGQFWLSGGVVGFVIGEYDRSLPLVIDPTLSYSTLLGGSNTESAMALAVDSSGSAYIAGFTASYDFPTASPEQSVSGGGNDVFVAKFAPSGGTLVYCTYIGGRGDDRAYAIAIDGTGAAYVAGYTTSTNFPLRNALQATSSGSKDAFILKLSPAGNSLVFSTYLGGGGADTANAIGVDSTGNVYVAGDTTSVNFPAAGMQKSNGGGQDAFVAKLSADGTRLLYSTYMGGTADDHAGALAVNASGEAYVTGSTWSANFPVANAAQPQLAGGQDAFVARLSADGKSLLFGTFLGGSGGAVGAPEAGQGIAIDAQGNAYVAGVTNSSDFPLLHALQISKRGSSGDAFVAKYSVSGGLVYSTYLGGTGLDSANAIAVDAAGCAYVAGQTFSVDLPVINAIQGTKSGDYDAFWAKLSAAGDSLSTLSYLGGSGSDTATAIALDQASNVYLAGWTLSPNFPLAGAYQSTNAGNYGAFVAKVGGAAVISAQGVSPDNGTGTAQTFAFQFSDSAGATDLTSVSVLVGASASTASACSVVYNRAANTLALLTDAGANPAGTIAPGSGSQQNSQCVLSGAGSGAALSGSVLTLTLALTFRPAFIGTKAVYLQAANASLSTGWQQRGSWIVPNTGAPAAVLVSPASGTGASQVFSFVFSDAWGYTTINTAQIVFNATLSAANGCFLYYLPSANLLYLSNDAGTAWQTPVTPGRTGTMKNSQCTIDAAASSVAGSGTDVTLSIAIAFQSTFAGAKKVYMEVNDPVGDSRWQQRGTWTVPVGSGPPTADSVSPASGSGTAQTFSFVFSDPRGYKAINTTQIVFNGTLAAGGGCFLYYLPSGNLVYLSNDAGNAWLAPLTPGKSGTAQNSQCSLDGLGSTASLSGNTITLNLALSFKASFTGTKKIYLEVNDSVGDSGWQQRGTWTVPAASGPPSAVSVSPGSGSGKGQTFSFVFSDPRGYSAINTAQIAINRTLSASGACFMYYLPSANLLYISNDTGTGWPVYLTPGSPFTIENGQCYIDGAGSSVLRSGNTLTLNVAITFKPSFSGTKNIYMEVNDSVGDSGWQQRGTWTVP